jgi:outer membrane autotransporter protein
MGGLAGDFATAAHGGAASSSEHSAGMLTGLTYRIDAKASAFFALGYDWGSVGGAGGAANVDSAIGVGGGRYGFASLEQGPFVAARAYFSGVDYQGARTLGGGLGVANGGAPGIAISGQAVFGDVIRFSAVTVTPQAGLRVVHVDLGGFQESGGELALAVERLSATTPSLLGGVEFGFTPWLVSGWTITPTIPLGAELTLGAANVSTSGGLYGLSVSQSAAYDSRYLLQGGLSVAARRGALEVKAEIDATHAADSNGVNGQVSVALSF